MNGGGTHSHPMLLIYSQGDQGPGSEESVCAGWFQAPDNHQVPGGIRTGNVSEGKGKGKEGSPPGGKNKQVDFTLSRKCA